MIVVTGAGGRVCSCCSQVELAPLSLTGDSVEVPVLETCFFGTLGLFTTGPSLTPPALKAPLKPKASGKSISSPEKERAEDSDTRDS